MYLVYYTTSDGERNWRLAGDRKSIDEYIRENDITEFYITVNDNECHRMENKIESLERKVEDIKRTLNDIVERC